MKYITRFILMGIVAVAGLLSACTSSDDFEPGPLNSGAQVYFPNTIPSEYNVGDDESSVTIPVRRVVTDAAMTVNILASVEQGQEGILNIPSSVTFEAGSDLANLVITFDRGKLVDGTEYKASLLINDEQNLTQYGNYMIDITIIPWPWEELGTGKYRDGWLYGIFEGNLIEIDVNIHKHKSKEGVYMVEEMFGWTFMTEFFGATQSDLSGQFSYTPTNITIDCSDPANVKIAKQYTGITEGVYNYGDFLIESAAAGTFDNGIITFPKDGINVYMTGYSSQSLPSNADGTFRIMLPGAEDVDYSLAAEYSGMKVAPDNVTASAVIDFTYGTDVTGINYVVAEGDVTASAAEIAAKIANGTAENIYAIEDFVAGGKKVSVEIALPATGFYTVVALPLDKTKKPVEANVTAKSFYFPGTNGGDIPECDLTAMLGLVSEYWPEMSEQCPDNSSLYFQINGSELKSLSTVLATTSAVESVLNQGASYEEIVAANGTDHTGDFMPDINEKGSYGSAWINLKEGTSYTMIVQATNIYGKSKVVVVEYSTTAPDYSDYTGELAIGNYTMTYQPDAETTFTNAFTIKPVSGSETDFIISDLGLDNSTSWHATYDPSTLKFTVGGVEVGYEDDGNYFGQLWGYWDSGKTQIFGFFCYADPNDENATGNDPCVFSVDPTSKQISALETTFIVPVFNASDYSLLGYAGYFEAGETVITYQSGATGSSKSAAAVRRVNIPFCSFTVPAGAKTSLRSSFAAQVFGKSKVAEYNGTRTLAVKTSKCEPLPGKQYNGKAKIKK